MSKLAISIKCPDETELSFVVDEDNYYYCESHDLNNESLDALFSFADDNESVLTLKQRILNAMNKKLYIARSENLEWSGKGANDPDGRLTRCK